MYLSIFTLAKIIKNAGDNMPLRCGNMNSFQYREQVLRYDQHRFGRGNLFCFPLEPSNLLQLCHIDYFHLFSLLVIFVYWEKDHYTQLQPG